MDERRGREQSRVAVRGRLRDGLSTEGSCCARFGFNDEGVAPPVGQAFVDDPEHAIGGAADGNGQNDFDRSCGIVIDLRKGGRGDGQQYGAHED